MIFLLNFLSFGSIILPTLGLCCLGQLHHSLPPSYGLIHSLWMRVFYVLLWKLMDMWLLCRSLPKIPYEVVINESRRNELPCNALSLLAQYCLQLRKCMYGFSWACLSLFPVCQPSFPTMGKPWSWASSFRTQKVTHFLNKILACVTPATDSVLLNVQLVT